MALGWAARLAILWCLLALLGDVLSQAQAQESTTSGDESGVIQEIRVEGNQRIEAATIRSYMTVAPGEPFDPAKLDQSLKNLFATGLFDDVSIRREGSDLVVTLVENPIINRIAFEGNLRLDDEVLTSEVQLRPRVVYTRSRVQNAVGRILELYRRNGRYGATVEPKVIQLPQNRVDLVFEINEGPLTEIERIVFIGNQAFDDGDLRGVIQTKESAWYRILSYRRHLRSGPPGLRPGAPAPVLPVARLCRLQRALRDRRAHPRRQELRDHLHGRGRRAVRLRRDRDRIRVCAIWSPSSCARCSGPRPATPTMPIRSRTRSSP